jgi:hypothetical protein
MTFLTVLIPASVFGGHSAGAKPGMFAMAAV